MAKYYTEQAPTPVFAVTFVSNRKGIVPPKTSNTPKATVDNSKEINALQQQLKNKQDELTSNATNGLPTNDSLILEINNLKASIAQLTSDQTTVVSQVEDTEYLVYSNLQIESLGPTDLSEQSNWYLRDAEVELTRDWPVCKAKLIVAAKLNDDGSIPQIKQVETGFIYNQSIKNGADGKPTNDIAFGLIPGGRFLSADDEVRIYAGYKNETCVTMNDLDQYPFDFSTIVNKKLSDPASAQLLQLEKDKKSVEEAISKLDNFLFDPNFYLGAAAAAVTAAGIALIIVGSAPVSIPTVFVSTGATVFISSAQGLSAVAVTTNAVGVASTTAVGLGTVATAVGVNDFKGAVTVNSNADLKKALQLELLGINNIIKSIQIDKGTEIKEFSSNKEKLAPIFWGFIDSVDFISNSDAGVQIIYNLRDRSRILADTKLVTLPYLNKDTNERGAFEGLRHKTIEGVYRATNGGIYLDNNYISATSTQWREGFNIGEVVTLYDNKIDGVGNKISDQVGKVTDIGSALAEQRIKFSAAIEDQARWTIANSFLASKDIKQTALSKYDPLFHIWTLQPPVVQGGGQSVMQIVNKSPFEILSYLQVTEVMPIDFFSSHVNGHFLFAPRVLDTTGLNDPERGNRLYFFFQCFDKVPEARSLIKDIRVQTSTIGVYNRFAIANAEFNNPTNASLKDLYTVVDIASANTKNRKVPIKQHIIVDPKIKDQANKEGYAQGLALTTASIMARDNTTVIFKIIGDSTFYPGEAVRVYNTVLHGKDTFTFNSQTESSAQFLKTLYEEVQKLKEGNGAVKQNSNQNKVVNLNAVIDKIRGSAGANSDELNDVLPMYKVRAITHSLKAGGSDAGYTTKIVAIADIL